MATKKSSSAKTDSVDIRTFLNVYKNSPTICEKFESEGSIGFQLTAEELALILKGDTAYHEEESVIGMISLCEALIAEGVGETVVLSTFPINKSDTVSLCTSISFVVQQIDGVVGIYDADKNLVNSIEVLETVIGKASHSVCEIGGVKLILPIRLSEDLRSDIYAKDLETESKGFEPQRFSGLPPKEVPSFVVDGDTIQTLGEPKIRLLSPKTSPLNTPIEILDMAEPDERYGTPKILVSVDGGKSVEMLVSAPIRDAVTGGGRPIDETDIGKKFEILGVIEYRPGGKSVPVSAEDDRPQKTVVARRIYGSAVAA
jgi:hypothetical protein